MGQGMEIIDWYGEDDCPTCQRWAAIREALEAKALATADPAGEDMEGEHIVHHVRDPKGDETAHG
jgi:hypothetical protein